MEDMAHFHYEITEIGPLKLELCQEEEDGDPASGDHFWVRVTSLGRQWRVRRTWRDLAFLDRQCHRCIYDRRVSGLREVLPGGEAGFAPRGGPPGDPAGMKENVAPEEEEGAEDKGDETVGTRGGGFSAQLIDIMPLAN